jgi:hypothetical protein
VTERTQARPEHGTITAMHTLMHKVDRIVLLLLLVLLAVAAALLINEQMLEWT